MAVLINTPVSCPPEFYLELIKIFADKKATPEDSLSTVMYRAGQQSVLDYIYKILNTKEVSGDIKDTIKPSSFVNRTVNKLTKR